NLAQKTGPHPGMDCMNKRHWLDCSPSVTHGNIIQRVIFTQHDPQTTPVEGAILNYVDSFARGYLEAGTASVPHVHKDIQEIFFVAAGTGTLIAGGENQVLREGDGILIPPGIKHTLLNNGGSVLELLILVESIPPSTRVKNNSVVIRNYRQSQVVQA